MRGGREAAAVAAAALVILGGCTSTTTKTASTSPETSPSATSSATQSSAPTPSPAPTPTGPLTIKSVPVHNGEVGLSFASITLSAGGGLPPYTWGLQGGSLPSGLSLSPQGVIGGSVSKAGTFKFTVSLADSGGSHATKATSITVYSALAVTQPCANACAVEARCTVCGTFGSASGGLGPFIYTVSAGAVPPGMGRSGLSLTGAFPNVSKTQAYPLTVLVRDQFGAQKSVSAKWSVFPHLTLATSSINCVQGSAQCVVNVSFSGGTPNGSTPTVSVGSFNPAPGPPRGFSVGATGNYTGGNLMFQANGAGGTYTGSVTVTLTDQSLCGPGAAHCSASLLINITL